VPGLFGVVQHRQRDDLTSQFGALFDPNVSTFRSESLVDDELRWAIGRAHLGVLQPEPQLVKGSAAHVLVHGDIYNVDEIADLVGAVPREGRGGISSLLAALYERFDAGFARHLDGAYTVVVLDPTRRRLLIATDSVASYPLYWAATSDEFVFAPELAAVLRHARVRRRLNPAAVADYLTFGFPLGIKTLAEGVDQVPPGTTLVFDWDTGAVTQNRFASVVDHFSPWKGEHRDYSNAVADAFERSVARALSGAHTFGMSLSGGVDSRAILSAASKCATTPLATQTLGVKGCADEVIAGQLARLAGTRHTFFELDDRYLLAFLPNLARMVRLTDGMYLSHGLTEILALDFLSSADFSVLLRGHGGELAKTSLAWPFHTDATVESFSSSEQLVRYLLTRTNYISTAVDLSALFTSSWFPMVDGVAPASLRATLADVPLSPADLCSYLYLTEHHRRVTTASLGVFRQAVDVRLPFVDPVFLGTLLGGRPSWRRDTTIHQSLVASGNAALLRVRNSNTGAAMNAGPLAEKVLDKVNSLFKKLSVPGYRHYHNFHAWMTQQLHQSVETVLLSRESLDRGILRAEGLRRLLDDTRAHRADHGYLLQVLLILELWQRDNL
jgi:asparagine synthase (glutamine-hydrolysing)